MSLSVGVGLTLEFGLTVLSLVVGVGLALEFGRTVLSLSGEVGRAVEFVRPVFAASFLLCPSNIVELLMAELDERLLVLKRSPLT